MKVIVAIPGHEPSFAAAQALQMEGVDFQAHLMLDDTDYGCLFADLWDEGDPFVIIGGIL